MPPDERDACGVGFLADLSGRASHRLLRDALTAVANMRHRGAVASDAKTGDGAGILTQIPFALLRRDLRLPAGNGNLAVGMLFLPQDPAARAQAQTLIEATAADTALRVLGWRDVPADPEALGPHAKATRPHIAQVVFGRAAGWADAEFDRMLYLCRRRIERRAAERALAVYVPSLSRRTIVYKGLFSSPQLGRFYLDLTHPAFETALAVIHQRYSTNTFPSWHLAQPFRYVGHNGEINTLQGNISWMQAREAALASRLWGDRLGELRPVIQPGGSDSAMLDNVLELLVTSGRDLPHSVLMLVPEAWEENSELDETARDFYAYHACLTEPWDGPAALVFSDGSVVGAALDRNGLRPARYCRTDDGLVIMASEAGVLDLPPEHIVEKGRLGPGQMIIADLSRGVFVGNRELKLRYARRKPYGRWLRRQVVSMGTAGAQPPLEAGAHLSLDAGPQPAGEQAGASLLARQRAAGYTLEDVERILRPMADDGKDPVFSMGDDVPPAVLAARPRPLYHYFKQRFAQVTNPPIDPLRERLVMSLATDLGPRGSFLEETEQHARLLHLPSPVLLPAELEWIREHGPFPVRALRATAPAAGGTEGFARALDGLVRQACDAARDGALILLTDAAINGAAVPIPMLLAVAAVHHALIRGGLRMRTSLIADASDAIDIHHVACLLGFGANAVCPRLALQTVASGAPTAAEAGARRQTYRGALLAGLRKIMSKMGISTAAGYGGAQIFEAVGLSRDLIERYFPGTPSRLEGIGLAEIAADALCRHGDAFAAPTPLAEAGFVRFRRGGDYHAFNPYVVKALHRVAHGAEGDHSAQFAEQIHSRPPAALRDLLEFVPQRPVPLDDVEPVTSILRRFVISAMSHGALSREAHMALAEAANLIGARSNSGEGGEDPARYHPRDGAGSSNSRIKQIASARFGVTPAYILSADELEIKMAQGSKPGEGGQLPGHKVTDEIARIRRAQPGATLISPPPHHDIYSIEDLAQLISDLKRIHPAARVAVKLVSVAGVGTIAAGVAKAFADTVHLSGNDGGTGASPLDSIKNAGVPWELGLAEVQQVLVHNALRDRVRLRVDGGLKTGRDVVIAALLGADEFGFGSAAVVALGCVMARQCHLNTCPVGIATQSDALRRKFAGRPEMVVAYFRAVAAQVREILASLGARSLDEIIGRLDLLRVKPDRDGRAARLDFTAVLRDPDPAGRLPRRNLQARNDRPDDSNLDEQILHDLHPALERGFPVHLNYAIRTEHRTVGGRVAGEIAARVGEAGLPAGAVTLRFTGAAGQSFGAFCVPGLRLLLEGEANDSVGKGMAGGEVAVFPSPAFARPSHRHVILGNTALYGATGGALFAAGRAGERFAVRNSGATAVVEGLGDHGCEYMTGGTVVVLGPVGRNFAAGMTGGAAFVLDEEGVLPVRTNAEHVQLAELTNPVDELRVITLILQHAAVTGSGRPREILEHWEHYGPMFRKVAPTPVAAPVPRGGEAETGAPASEAGESETTVPAGEGDSPGS